MYEILEQLLIERNLKLSELADNLNITRQILYYWKSGRSLPKADILLKIARYFDVSIEYLMTGEDSGLFPVTWEPNDNLFKEIKELPTEEQDLLKQIIRTYLDASLVDKVGIYNRLMAYYNGSDK